MARGNFREDLRGSELARFASAIPELPGAEAPIKELNELFRDALAEVWDGQAVSQGPDPHE